MHIATESNIKKSIIGYLHSIGAWTVKTWGNRYMRDGLPDILACYKGIFVALEVKRPGEQPTKLQEYELKMIRNAGGIAEVVCSKEDVEKIIYRINNNTCNIK